MVIAFSLTNLELGGAQIFVIRMASEMAKMIDKPIYIYDHNPEYRNNNILLNIDSRVKVVSYSENKIIRFFVWKINGLLLKFNSNFQFKEWVNKRKFNHFIKQKKIEIVNSHMAVSDFIVGECKSKFKFVVTLHGEYELNYSDHPNKEYIKQKIIFAVDKADDLIFTADKNFTAIQDLLYTKKNLPTKIYVGFSANSLVVKKVTKQFLGLSEKDFVIGMVSRGIPEKGWDTAIEVLNLINTRDTNKVNLLCIGEGEYLKNLIEKQNNPHILLKQFTDNFQDYFSYYSVFDVLLFPSRFKGESVPNTVIEALYWDKPVIASNIAEVKNMISDENGNLAGEIVMSLNYEEQKNEFKELVTKYINDKNYLIEKSRIAKNAVKKFEMSKIMNQYLEVFKKLL